MKIIQEIPPQILSRFARALVRAPETQVRVQLSYIRLLSSIDDRYQPPGPQPS